MSGGGITVVEAQAADHELVEAFARLTPQLSRSAPAPGANELAEMVAAPGTCVLLARDGAGTIVGTLTLVVFRIPTGVRAWVEDVVTDAAAQRQGVATELLRAAVAEAAARGARTVDLTSRPDREAANKLYQKLGFEVRETNVYRLVVQDRDDP